MVTTNIPMSGDHFVASCKKWGLTVVEHGDWRNHNRNGGGRIWGPTNGFLVHNTWSTASDASMLSYLTRGDAARGMPGPLVPIMMGKDGTIHMIGWGRSNHAGVGDGAVLARVVKDDVPLNGELTPKVDNTDGNARFVGVEMNYKGSPTAAQRKALPLLCAAFLDVMGWDATSVIAHREWTRQRSDPEGFEMGQLRRQVQALLRSGSTLSKPVGTLPMPKPAPEEDDMPYTPEQLADAIWTGKPADRIPAPKANLKADPSNANWTPSSYLYYTYASLQDARAQIEGLSAAVKALAASHGANGDAVVEAVRSEVSRAMQGLEVTLTAKPEA